MERVVLIRKFFVLIELGFVLFNIKRYGYGVWLKYYKVRNKLKIVFVE